MRAKRLGGLSNDRYIRRIARELAKLSGLKGDTFRYVTRLMYLGVMHDIACTSRDNRNRSDEVTVEIPYIGLATFKIGINSVSMIDIKYEDDFVKDLTNAVEKGKSNLELEINRKLSKDIRKRYENMLK